MAKVKDIAPSPDSDSNFDDQQSDSDEPKATAGSKKMKQRPTKKKSAREKDSADDSDCPDEVAAPAKRRLGKSDKLRLKRKERKTANDKELLLNAREVIPFGERVDAPPKFTGAIGREINAGMSQAGSKNLLLKALLAPREDHDSQPDMKQKSTNSVTRSARKTQEKKPSTASENEDKSQPQTKPVPKKQRKQLVKLATNVENQEGKFQMLAPKKKGRKQPATAKLAAGSEDEEKEKMTQQEEPASKKKKGGKQAAASELIEVPAPAKKNDLTSKKRRKPAAVELSSSTSENEAPQPTHFNKSVKKKEQKAVDSPKAAIFPSKKSEFERSSARLAARGVERPMPTAKKQKKRKARITHR